jgi:hypothetical protein
MSDVSPRRSARAEAVAGIAAGIVLALIAWFGTGVPSAFLSSHLSPNQATAVRQVVPGAAAVLPTATPTPLPPTDCVAPASIIGSTGFDPYAILLQKRPDVLRFYAQNGWNPAVQCVAIYDNWTKAGAGGTQPTTPAAFVKAQGWAPAAPVATPAPPADCTAPASEVAQLGFDPYPLLALHRPDVLNLYKLNGWNPDTQCVKLFDDWLQHPDGGPPVSAAAFVVDKGWAKARVPAATATPEVTASPAASATPVAAGSTATPQATAEERATPSPNATSPATYTVQPGDTLFAIAQREHVSLDALEQANGISNANVIQAGQVLRLPTAAPTP